MKDKYSVIVADDHPLIRMGVQSILKGSVYEVIYEAKDGAEALEKCKELLPDVLITDISMPSNRYRNSCSIQRTSTTYKNG